MQNRTYRYFKGQPLYSFGYGLSYTTFTYSNLRVPTSPIKAGEPVTIEADVKNTGRVSGDEVAELYVTQPRGFETPQRELASFTRIHLAPGQSIPVKLTIDPRSLGQVDEKGNRVILPGDYGISFGGTQPGPSARTQTGTFTLIGRVELAK
jgi:beta-glucosidase